MNGKCVWKRSATVGAGLWVLASLGCGSSSGEAPVTPDSGAMDTDAGGLPSDAGGPPSDAGGPPPQSGVIAAGVRWFGRVDTTNAAGPRFSWSGTGFVARFSGTSLTAQLAVTGTSQIFKAVVKTDLGDMEQAPFTAPVGQGMYPLATGLTAGVHTVALYRQTEGPQGETQLLGLTVGDGALMDPPPGPDRLIEVIGDSITCGYGDLGTISDTECLSTESHWDSYEAVSARDLLAEVSTIAASGRGVIRNYGGDTTGTMPLLYAHTLTNLSTPLWDFHIIQPQAVVINLGTNDISNSKGDPGLAFRDTYAALLATVRTNYPDAWIVCIIGPLLSGSDLAIIQGYIQSAVDMRTAAGDQKVEFFNKIVPQTVNMFACQAHPNKAEHKIMADLLTAELRAKLGW
jgi:lysophospholipase L1-like esterase